MISSEMKEALEDTETIVDSLYLAKKIIHDDKIARVPGREVILSEERIDRVISKLTFDSEKRGEVLNGPVRKKEA